MAGARLLLEEREEIALGIARGRSLAGAARTPRRPVSTVARAIAGNGNRGLIGPSFWNLLRAIVCPSPRRVVSHSVVRWLGRSSGACRCGTRPSRSQTGYA